MTLEMWLVLGILATAVLFFITEWLRVDVVAVGVVLALMLTGVLTTSEALAGFSSTAVLTIAGLFVVGGAVLHTGLAGAIGRRILAVAGDSEWRLVLVIMGAVALLSGFMSDTGTVAVLLPAIISLSINTKISPAKLLIPLAFGSLLGGAMTLIGTPPNIIVSDVLRDGGYEPFFFFSYTPMGLILAAIGITFMLLVGRRLLPDRMVTVEKQVVATPKELIDAYRLPENLLRLRVRRGSDLIGKTVFESDLRDQFDVTVLKIMRPPSLWELAESGRTDTDLKDTPLIPDEEETIQRHDVLVVQGENDAVNQAAIHWNMAVQPAKPKDSKALLSREVGVAELLLPPRSSLVGKTLEDVRFGTTYRLTVLAISRPGAGERLDLKTTKLQFGDTLIVQGRWRDISHLRDFRRDFVVMGEPESEVDRPPRSKARWAAAIMVGMLVLMVGEFVPVVTAVLVAALLVVLTGCLTMDKAYDAIDWKSIVLIAGMLPMSTALQKVGLVDMIANGFVDTLGGSGPLSVMLGLFLLTSLFTQVLSNTATTVVIAPIALVAAETLDIQPQAFLMAVAIAASMAFASPVASPTNTLVMGAGNYRFSDYVKVGVPLIILMLVAVALLLPLIFPF
ncbi:SLC13 family permease [Candidatus Leptofilum sp.]|uniref:SLC13 family permease n=1 Tax=Candidatus Leptofilum sp. TaxID=3241576 RepID=UPI003B5BB4D3